jgi:hypothetical protein
MRGSSLRTTRPRPAGRPGDAPGRAIEEQLKDRDAAKLCDQLIAQYPSDPAAAEAKAGLGRLKATP